jgi:hypothetical protein
MKRPVPGWDPRPRPIDLLWSRVWPYLAAILAGVLTAIAVVAVLAGWP